ncbi:hypothetical protein HYW18_00345 [Candidatus Uhrbacteria bacterium]|nr:hypothetical protein [Candidatus Uhrbacteria bacterium]
MPEVVLAWQAKMTHVCAAIVRTLLLWENVTENIRLHGRVVVFLVEQVGGDVSDLPVLREAGLVAYHQRSQSYSVNPDAEKILAGLALCGDPSAAHTIASSALARLHDRLVADPNVVYHLRPEMFDPPDEATLSALSEMDQMCLGDTIDSFTAIFDFCGARDRRRRLAAAALRKHARAQVRRDCEPLSREDALETIAPPYDNPRSAAGALRHLVGMGWLVKKSDGTFAITREGYDFAFAGL